MNTATLTPTYQIDARVVGYAVNDGRFVAQRVRPVFWDRGWLKSYGTSRFLGVFDTQAEAQVAIDADAAAWAAEDKAVEDVR